MYPAPFEYHVPSTVAEAVALLGKWQDDAKLISGSQSLVPMMKLRLVQPKHVIDLRKVPGLAGVSESDGALLIGALTTYRAIETSEIARSRLPILPETAGNIGDAQVRNLGTIGGSLAHADPSADWPAVTIALDASVSSSSPGRSPRCSTRARSWCRCGSRCPARGPAARTRSCRIRPRASPSSG